MDRVDPLQWNFSKEKGRASPIPRRRERENDLLKKRKRVTGLVRNDQAKENAECPHSPQKFFRSRDPRKDVHTAEGNVPPSIRGSKEGGATNIPFRPPEKKDNRHVRLTPADGSSKKGRKEGTTRHRGAKALTPRFQQAQRRLA